MNSIVERLSTSGDEVFSTREKLLLAERIKGLEVELASIAKSVNISIPSQTMEQEFQSHYRRGYEAGYRAAIEAAEKVEPVAKCIDDDKWNCKYCNKTNTCEALQDKRNYATPQPAPDGMVLVPVEPTREMLFAADEKACELADRPKGFWYAGLIYKAMLAAAPKEMK